MNSSSDTKQSRLCSFDGCGRKYHANGFCAGHNRQHKAGEELRQLAARRKTTARDEHGNRLCTLCGRWQPEDQFRTQASAADGLSSDCTNCRKNRDLVRTYGLTLDEYRRMLDSQNGGCAICGQSNPGGRALAVDHDHACCPGAKTCGKCIRALLCDRCNRMLGLAQDSRDLLASAGWYLRKHGR